MKTKAFLLVAVFAGMLLASCSNTESKINADSLRLDSLKKLEATKAPSDTIATDTVPAPKTK